MAVAVIAASPTLGGCSYLTATRGAKQTGQGRPTHSKQIRRWNLLVTAQAQRAERGGPHEPPLFTDEKWPSDTSQRGKSQADAQVATQGAEVAVHQSDILFISPRVVVEEAGSSCPRYQGRRQRRRQ